MSAFYWSFITQSCCTWLPVLLWSIQWTHENAGELPFLSPDTSKRIHAKFNMPTLPSAWLIDPSSLDQSEGITLGRGGGGGGRRWGGGGGDKLPKPTTETSHFVVPSVKPLAHTRLMIFHTAELCRYSSRVKMNFYKPGGGPHTDSLHLAFIQESHFSFCLHQQVKTCRASSQVPTSGLYWMLNTSI